MIVTLFIIIALLYLALIGSFAIGFDKVTTFKLKDLKPKTKFSIVIPFRNEEKHLPKLLQSLFSIDYPKTYFEIIFINDDSTDNSLQVINTICKKESNLTNLQVLSNNRVSKSPKKDAITLGVSKAKYDWIITTDADCTVPKYWLAAFDEYIQQKQVECIVAPVQLRPSRSFVESFQQLDMLSLKGATIGGFGIKKPFLCNGANFAYTKALFNDLDGFNGNNTIASGDDIFFLEKALRYNPKAVKYLKCEHSIVQTEPQESWNHLIAQRQRWASKTRTYKNAFGKLTGFIVFLMNAAIVIGVVLCFLSIISMKTLFYIWFLKLNVDLWLIYKSAVFFDLKSTLKFYWSALFIYPFFTTYIAIKSQFSSYSWKGRMFAK